MTTATATTAPSTSDDLAAELLRRRRRRLPVLTAILAVAVLLAVGIVGGIEIQKHRSSTSTTGAGAARSALASRFGGASAAGARGGFGGFGGAAGGGATTGTVTLIKGSTLYVTDASGNTVLVKTTPTSRVTKTVSGTLQSVHPGDTVTVTGTPASNGSTTATSISIGSGASNG